MTYLVILTITDMMRCANVIINTGRISLTNHCC